MTTNPTEKRVEREARLVWVPIPQMRVSPMAQRELNNARVSGLAAEFDLEQLGTPTVNERDGLYYVIDGQHRVEALRLMGWGDQSVQCWSYAGLTETEEAEKFLKLNDVLAVHGFAKFRVGVHAGREEEVDIDRIVRGQQLHISQDKKNGSIGCVGTLRRVYRRSGPATLARTLGIIREAYGDPGLEASVVDGLGLLCHRYSAELDDIRAIERLGGAHGGVNGLLGKAENLRRQTGNPKAHCIAAAAVDIINSGRGGKKLPSWWRAEE